MRRQPHSPKKELQRRMQRLAGSSTAWSGTFFRSCAVRYAVKGKLLSGLGSKRIGGRWTPRGAFAAVYGSLSPETALAEALAEVRYYGFKDADAMSRVFVAVSCRLKAVLDITAASHSRSLGVSRKRMRSEDWREAKGHGRESLTQSLARSAFDAGIEALIVPSAADPTGRNIVIFPSNLRAGSRISIVNPHKLPR